MRISVAGVAEKNGKVLIGLRKPGTSIGVKWEFPGGKLENGESPEEALKREYEEELGLLVSVKEKLCEGSFSNGLKKYRLLAFSVLLDNEEYTLTEHQEIKWVDLTDLGMYEFPKSDGIIVDYLLSR